MRRRHFLCLVGIAAPAHARFSLWQRPLRPLLMLALVFFAISAPTIPLRAQDSAAQRPKDSQEIIARGIMLFGVQF